MQAFLPLPNFVRSACCLDNKRLGSQVFECSIIYNELIEATTGWQNYPVIKMWKPFPGAFVEYALFMYEEWMLRFKNGKRGGKLTHQSGEYLTSRQAHHLIVMPCWIGNQKLHGSHRAALLAKDWDWYSQYGWGEKPRIKYWYPGSSA